MSWWSTQLSRYIQIHLHNSTIFRALSLLLSIYLSTSVTCRVFFLRAQRCFEGIRQGEKERSLGFKRLTEMMRESSKHRRFSGEDSGMRGLQIETFIKRLKSRRHASQSKLVPSYARTFPGRILPLARRTLAAARALAAARRGRAALLPPLDGPALKGTIE